MRSSSFCIAYGTSWLSILTGGGDDAGVECDSLFALMTEEEEFITRIPEMPEE